MLVVVNPFSYSSVIASDRDLAYGVFDTKTNLFFSVSNNVEPAELHALIREGDTFFNQNGRVYTIARSAIRPIAVIMSTSRASYYHNFCDQASLTLPLGIICSILLVLVWSHPPAVSLAAQYAAAGSELPPAAPALPADYRY